MSEGSEQETHVRRQYRDASNLSARVELHRRFSTNRYGWQRWMLDQIELPPDARVLEVGCGRGDLWVDNADRIPGGWRITLSDRSPGMLEAAEANLAQISARISGQIQLTEADAQSLPWAAAAFDGVIANHMLYHVSDLGGALSEIARVLRPSGRLYASTNGRGHMRELTELLERVGLAEATLQSSTETFTLENGAEALRRGFDEIALRRYEDGLSVVEVVPLLDYVRSMTGEASLPDGVQHELSRVWERELMVEGVIRITKESGLFVATRRP